MSLTNKLQNQLKQAYVSDVLEVFGVVRLYRCKKNKWDFTNLYGPLGILKKKQCTYLVIFDPSPDSVGTIFEYECL